MSERGVFFKAVEIVREEIPDNFESKDELFAKLDWLIEDASYRAPEALFLSWKNLNNVLVNNLGEVNTEWKSLIMERIIELCKKGS